VDDKVIATLLRQHDDDGMAALIQKYGRLIRYVISGILGTGESAEDCYSEVCMRIWEKAAEYDETRGSLRTFLTVIARNTAVDMLRLAKRRESFESSEAAETCSSDSTPEKQFLQTEEKLNLYKAIEKLSWQERNIFYRKYYYMQSVKQIAAELGLPQRAVEGRLYRIRKRLQKELGGELT